MDIKKVKPLSATYPTHNNNKQKKDSKNKKDSSNIQTFKEVFEKTKREREEER